MMLVVVRDGAGGEGQLDVGSFAQCVLRGVCATHLRVEQVATIAGAYDNGSTHEAAKGFEDFLAQLLQHGDVLLGDTVYDVVLFCCGRVFKLVKGEMIGELNIFHKEYKF